MSVNISKVPSSSPNFNTEAAKKIKDLFPEVVADGKIDFEALKTLLDPDLEGERERFGLFWPGKTQAIRAAQQPTTATLKPDFKNSKNWDTTQNVFIEGDNLEVPKILQKHYYGKIKMIYIEIAFIMSASKEGLKESYLLMAGFLDDGTVLDAEQMRDLLDLTCVQERITAVPEDGFSELIDKQISDLSNDVQERNAVFYLQQEELIEAARLDLKATFDAKIREFHAKENTASKAARKASDAMEKLRLTREARHWQNKAEQADDEYRQERNRLHAKSEKFLNKVEKSLQAKHEVRDLFTISWDVEP